MVNDGKKTILNVMASLQTLQTPFSAHKPVARRIGVKARSAKIIETAPSEWSDYPVGENLSEKTGALYSDTHRRISGMYAVDCHFAVPVMSCFSTNAPYPERDIHNFSREGWLHFYESEDTLYAHSWEIGENTWISTPERSLIETAFVSFDYRYPEWLMKVLAGYILNPRLLFDISENLGMADGFRRLAAISTLYPYVCNSKTPEWILEMQEYAKYINGTDILLCDGIPLIGLEENNVCEDFGVIWNFAKQEIIDEIYT